MRSGAVSQSAIERAIGKLATDEEFCTRFFENPAAATWEAGLPLSPIELEVLSGLSRAAIARFSASLDGRIRRRYLAGTPSYFASYRLPELYAGIERQPGHFPVQYVGANVPQAWTAGSVFHLLQAILGLRADAPRGRLLIDPQLPTWLPDVTLRGLAVGRARVDLRFWRDEDATRWDASVRDGQIAIERQAWDPWDVAMDEQTEESVRRHATASGRGPSE